MIDALAIEWKQLDTLSVFKGRIYESLNKSERYLALKTVQLNKEKKDGKIKGCTCVNGSQQRLYTAEEDASSLTVSTEALLITAAIDVAEQHFVATSPGYQKRNVTRKKVFYRQVRGPSILMCDTTL